MLRVVLFLDLCLVGYMMNLLGSYHRMPVYGVLGVAFLLPATAMLFEKRWAGWTSLFLLVTTLISSVYAVYHADLTPPVIGVEMATSPEATLYAVVGGASVALVLLIPYFRKY